MIDIQRVKRVRDRLIGMGLIAIVAVSWCMFGFSSVVAQVPLPVPVLISPSDGSSTEANFPTFQWRASADAVAYDLQVDDDPAFASPVVNFDWYHGTDYTDPSSIPNGTYYWRVQAWSQQGDSSGWSDPFKFKITGPYEVPSEFPDIQSAISAIPIYSGGEVLVAPGTYTGTGNRNLGGFGDKSIQVRSESGPAVTIIDCQNLGSGFYFDSYTGAGTVIDGFTISNASGGEGGGGAFECYSAWITINNCIVEKSQHEAMIVRNGARPTITRTTFRNNGGSGIYVFNGGNVVIDACNFYQNRPEGLTLDGSNSTTVITNTSFSNSIGWEGEGTGVRVYNSSTPSFDGCTFQGNESSGLYTSNSSVSLNSCTFSGNGNQWNYGGGMYISSNTGKDLITLDDCTLENNQGYYGGGIFALHINVNMSGSLFDGNTAQSKGGGVYLNWASNASAVGCTFVNNAADSGSAFYIESDPNKSKDGSGQTQALGGAGISECLLAFATQGEAIFLEQYAWIEIGCTNIYGNAGGDWVTGSLPSQLGANGNISADPLFCNAVNDDYSVTANSPVADANTSCATIGAFDVGCAAIQIGLSPTPLTFAGAVDGPNPAAQNLQITNLGGSILNWTLTKKSGWLQISNQAGAAPATVVVSIDKAEMLSGIYYDTLVVVGDDAINSPQFVGVSFTITDVDPPTLLVGSSSHPITAGDTMMVAVNVGDNLGITFVSTTQLPDVVPVLSISNQPAGSAFDSVSPGVSRFDWTPVPQLSGTHYITIIADDDYQTASLVVGIAINSLPQFTSDFSDENLIEGEPLTFVVNATDNDPVQPTIGWNEVPATAVFDNATPGTATLTFTPDYNDVDAVYEAVFVASDGIASVTDTLVIRVANRQLTVQSMQPSPGAADDILVSDSILIQFNEAIDASTLAANLAFTSAKGASLGYTYVGAQNDLLIGAASGYLESHDTIGVTLNAGVRDLAGYSLDQVYVETFVTGAAVYPGDANDDGIVDERDVLPLGLYYGNTGPARSTQPDLTWTMAPGHIAFGGERWTPAGGAYADADGSGVVDADDICGITENWSSTHTVSGDDKDSPVDLATSLAMQDQDVLLALYEAVITCPDGVGKSYLRETLQALLDQPPSDAALPNSVELYQNYPNPFNPFTTIRFYLPSSGKATLSIFNMLGQRVATLIDGSVNAGYIEADWDGTDLGGGAVASGIYFYRLETAEFSETKRMLLLK